MQTEFTIVSFFILALIILGVITGTILWCFPRNTSSSNKILAIAVLGILWTLGVAYAFETRLIIHVPHLYRTGYFAFFLFTPLLYLYVRNTAMRKALSVSDTVHFIPAILFMVDFAPFFILEGEVKQNMVLQGLPGIRGIRRFGEGWLMPAWFQFIFRYAVLVFYWILQARVVYLLFRKRQTHHPRAIVLRNWLLGFTSVQLLGFVPLVLRGERFYWIALVVGVGLPIAIIAIWLFLRPEILYGLHIHCEKKTEPVSGHKANVINGREISTKPSHQTDFSDLLHKCMTEDEKFLQHKYSIQNLANDLRMPPHQVSHLLNQHLHISFHDFLNKYRVERCIERIKKGDAQKLTLEALSFECGFNNRNSFIAAFKRFTGVTPSDYMRSLNFPIENKT